VDHYHFIKTQLPGSFGQSVLALLAFKMETDLLRTRLPNVNVGCSAQVLHSNLLAHVSSRRHNELRPPLAVTHRSIRHSELDWVGEVCPTASFSQRAAFADDKIFSVLSASTPPL